MTLTGLYVPIITPFTDNDELDCTALETLVHDMFDDGAAGIVALGTTGEPATLTAAERRMVIEICAAACSHRGTRLIVGIGSNSTADSVDQLGRIDEHAVAALTVVPYYTRPSEDGVVEHFRRLAAASPVPIIVYNVPYRTGRPLSADTLRRIAELPNVAGFKHSVGGIDDATIDFMSTLPSDTTVLAGDDLFAGPLIALGAAGAIMASANVATRAYVDLINAWRDGPIEHARGLHDQLAPLSAALFTEPNPVVIKAVLAEQGRIPNARVRLPLLPASDVAAAAALSVVPLLPIHRASSTATGCGHLRSPAQA